MNKKVSVIIPTFGADSNLNRAVDSVLAQDYENTEIVVVDDNGRGSDQQLINEKVLQNYKDLNNVLYVIHDVNKGGSAARNTGVAASSGEYLCFLDDDDEFADSRKISKQMNVAKDLDDDWAGTYSSLRIYRGNEFLRAVSASPSGYVLEEFIKDNLSIGTAAPIITRKSFNSINGFEESFKRHQDWEFYCRLLDRYKLKAVPDAYYHRCYKTGVKRKSAKTRQMYMDKYVAFMKSELRSLPRSKVDSLMRRKYVSVVLAYLREGNYNEALKICTQNKYRLSDYLALCNEACNHFKNKLMKKM